MMASSKGMYSVVISLTIVMIVIVVRSTTSHLPAGAFDTHTTHGRLTGRYVLIGHGCNDLNFDEWCRHQ
jgi:hypothetical protein